MGLTEIAKLGDFEHGNGTDKSDQSVHQCDVDVEFGIAHHKTQNRNHQHGLGAERIGSQN
ncbi:uncharacterized protein METZ01_LOCUS474692, partial [marine metagenome]